MKVIGINQRAVRTGETFTPLCCLTATTLGAVSMAWPRPAEIRPPWGTLGIDAHGAQSFAKAAFSKETTASA